MGSGDNNAGNGATGDTGDSSDSDSDSGWLSSFTERIVNAFLSFKEGLDNIIETVLAIPQTIIAGIKALFIPTIDIKAIIVDKFNEKIPLDTLISFKTDVLAIMYGIYAEVPSVVVPLKNSSLGKYGVDNFVINFTWFEPYIDTIHSITGGFLWLSFMLWLFFDIKGILNATSSGAKIIGSADNQESKE